MTSQLLLAMSSQIILRDAREFLYDIRRKWYDIGVELDVPTNELDTIRDKFKDQKDCLNEMLKERLKKPLTWSELSKALRARYIDEEELADEGELSGSHNTYSGTSDKGHSEKRTQKKKPLNKGHSSRSQMSTLCGPILKGADDARSLSILR